MKNYIFYFALLVICIPSCTPHKYSHLEVYNSSDTKVSAIINEESYDVMPKQKAYIASTTRMQQFEFENDKQLIKTQEEEKFLINLMKDTIIKLELIYGPINNMGQNPETNIPYRLIKLRDKKYYVPAEVITDKLVIRKYDFSINEASPNSISSDSDQFKNGSYLKPWTEYYKLYTVDEFMKVQRAVNNDSRYVAPILEASIVIMNPSYSFELNRTFISTLKNRQNIGDIGEARVSNDDVLEISDRRIHDLEKDGNITEVVARIPLCNIYTENKLLHREVSVDIVLCDKIPNTRIVVK